MSKKILCFKFFIAFIAGFNPFKMLMKIKEPMLTAFITRSFAAALQISLRVAKLSGLVEEDE